MNTLRESIKSSRYFYREYYRRISNLLWGLFLLILILTGAIIYYMVQRPLPAFYASSVNGNLARLNPMSTPNYSSKPLIE